MNNNSDKTNHFDFNDADKRKNALLLQLVNWLEPDDLTQNDREFLDSQEPGWRKKYDINNITTNDEQNNNR